MTSLYAGKGFYVNADSIEIVQEWGSRMSEREKKRAVDRGQFYDACRGRTIRCLITLKSGWVIACSNGPDAVVSRPLIHPPIKPSVRRAKESEEEGALRDLLNNSGGEFVLEDDAPPSPRPPRKRQS